MATQKRSKQASQPQTVYQRRVSKLAKDPKASDWLRYAVASLEDRDPADALNDALALVRFQAQRNAEV